MKKKVSDIVCIAPDNFFWGFLCFSKILRLIGIITIFCQVTLAQQPMEDHQGPSDFDFETIQAFLGQGQPGVLVTFLGDPAFQASRLQMTYYLGNKQTFQGKFMICNQINYDLDYRIFMLVDHQQLTYKLDENVANSHRIFLARGVCKTSTFKIEAPGDGKHDLIMAGIRYQDDLPMQASSHYGLIMHRATLLRNEGQFLVKPLLSIVENNRASTDADIELNCAALVSNRRQKVEPQSDVLLKVANPYKESLSLGLVLFAGETQIPMGNKDGSHNLFFKLGPDKSTQINIAVQSTQLNKPLWALTIENPYTVLETSPGVIAQLPTAIRLSNVLDSSLCKP